MDIASVYPSEYRENMQVLKAKVPPEKIEELFEITVLFTRFSGTPSLTLLVKPLQVAAV